MAERHIDGQELQDFMTRIFQGLGMPAEDAELEAEVLLWANLRGIDSHGVQRVAEYAGQIDAGNMNVRPRIRIIKETPAVTYIEGDRALGPIVTVFAVDQVADKARQMGVGWALIRNTTHQGAMGYYSERLAQQGLAGIAVVCNAPNTAPYGARCAGVHNSPISIAVPRRDGPPLNLDMATSVAAYGKVHVAVDRNASIPDDWAVDAAGRPTTDPRAVKALRPAGGYKGSGLALMFECLTSLMAANPLLTPVLSGDGARPATQNSFVAAVDISLFTDADAYAASVEELTQEIRHLPVAEDADEVLVPGDKEERIRQQRQETGIPLPEGTVAKLVAAAERLNVALPEALR